MIVRSLVRLASVSATLGDLFRYGTTNPYSSPGHYYRDQHRAYDHARRHRWEDRGHHESDFYWYGER